MKPFILSLVTLLLMAFSFSAIAERIIVTGEPLVIEKKDEIYVPAAPVTPHDYYYFSVDNTKRVCYKEVQPSLAKIDAGIFAVQLGNDVVNLHCYDYNTEYFTAP